MQILVRLQTAIKQFRTLEGEASLTDKDAHELGYLIDELDRVQEALTNAIHEAQRELRHIAVIENNERRMR